MLDTQFRQQRLKAWQPILRPSWTIPFLLILGLIYVALGVVFLVVSNETIEVEMDYTSCILAAGDSFAFPAGSSTYEWRVLTTPNITNVCQLRFSLSSAISGPVYLYFGLTNYYQNHRLYVKSVEPDQLSGQALRYSALSSCDPLQGPPGFDALGDDRPVYYPCGLIGNSFFNDTIGNPVRTGDNMEFVFSTQDIIWPKDLNKYGPTQYTLTPSSGSPPVVAPPFWTDPDLVYPNGSYKSLPDLGGNPRFVNWMRTASLPTFRKLYGQLASDLPAGTYIMTIHSIYEVIEFGGTKSIILSNASFLGGRNSFLGIIYTIMGSLFLLVGLAFLIRHLMAPRRLGDPRYLSWNQVSPLQ